MKRLLAMLWILPMMLMAAETLEKDILINGELKSGTAPSPDGWTFVSQHGHYYFNGGPNNLPYVTFSIPAGNKPYYESRIKQTGLRLVVGEKYRISCQFRTKDFHAARACFLVVDYGWFHSFGINDFPANTDGWQTITKDIIIGGDASSEKGFEENKKINGPFSAILYLHNHTGEIEFANPSLIPLTENARKGSGNANDFVKPFVKPAPLAARLNALPEGTTSIPIYWRHTEPVTAKATIDGHPAEITEDKMHSFLLNLKPYTTGRHDVEINITEQDGKTYSKSFSYGFAIPELAVPGGERRLNSLTTEILNQELKQTSSVTVTVPRHTWVYFKLEGGAKTTASLSGDKNPLFTPDSFHQEAQRRLPQGKYTVTFSAPVTGRFIARTVPIIYKYSGLDFTRVPEGGGYDMDFHNKHYFGVFNTIGARGVPEDKRPYTASLGLECVDSTFCPSRWSVTQENIDKYIGMINDPKAQLNIPSSQWVELDEFFWPSDEGLLVAANGFEKVKNPYNKYFHHWFGGADGPLSNGIQTYVMSNFMNVSDGRGYVAYEVYFRPKRTEEEAEQDMGSILSSSIARMNNTIPNSNCAVGYIFGNYHHLPIISLDWYPDVNFKYFLDMQYHYLVNHPEFNGIAMTGYWGFSAVNEEVGRWTSELVRHYVLEGRKDRLSDKYGYTYLLPYIKNGDFEDKLNGWTCEGNVTTGSFKGFGALNQLRYASSGIGDKFAVLEGNPEKRPTLKQTVSNLVPGKTYYLEYLTADYDDTKAARVNPKLFDITPTLSNAKIVHQYSHVDKRTKGTYNAVTGKTTYRNYRFVPTATSLELTFTGSAVKDEHLIMNYVRIAPYFE